MFFTQLGFCIREWEIMVSESASLLCHQGYNRHPDTCIPGDKLKTRRGLLYLSWFLTYITWEKNHITVTPVCGGAQIKTGQIRRTKIWRQISYTFFIDWLNSVLRHIINISVILQQHCFKIKINHWYMLKVNTSFGI